MKMNKIDLNKYSLDLELINKKRSFSEMIYVFVMCAMFGWLVEVVYVFIDVGRFSDRGMIYGPFCGIYGFGGVILYSLFYNLKPITKNIPYAFFVSGIFMGAFELLSGLFFKYALNIEMWNYNGRFLEILNYTTVPIIIGWGILGTIYIFFLQPLLLKIVYIIPLKIRKRLAWIILICYFLNFVISSFNIYINPEILYNLVNP